MLIIHVAVTLGAKKNNSQILGIYSLDSSMPALAQS